jgi:hypothetical protein
MKKALLILALAIGGTLTCSAQYNTNTYLNAGFGLSNWGLPVYVGYEFPVAQDINLGFNGSFRSKTESYKINNERVQWTHTVIGLNLRGAYYADRVLDIPSDFDFYGGLDLGFYIWNTKQKSSFSGVEYNGGDLGGLGLSAFVGGRYFFNPNTAINLELGGGNVASGGRIGVSFVL